MKIQHKKVLAGTAAVCATLALVLNQTGAFAKVTTAHAHPPTAAAIVKKVTDSKALAAYLHLKPQILKRDLKHHMSLLDVAVKEKRTKPQLLGELSVLVRTDVAQAQKTRHLSAAETSLLEKDANAMLGRLIVNTKVATHKKAPLSGGLIKEVATILHSTPATVKAKLRAHESILQMADAAHLKESVLISDLVSYRAKHEKRHVSTAVLTKQVEHLIVKK
ncbi:hypothetical protein [Ferroacidibacillus organovorans]|uniref:DUF5667 domain-containing protein n=1 Tax=Ferroacidibacillus organovorans TaxID=1765683 RepID=A0A853K794_9BACL|nr:hypothetical protein [Ferroacidibacillus organovorans]KYP80992.1 hypothetical protein AYJ22_09435 [Ferroacidibacillus organovorans]OAG90783.1 hypothetical protein AYW79_14050 [Ferroacidibacillus organovorans]